MIHSSKAEVRMSFHFPTKNSQILLDFRPNPGEPSLKLEKENLITNYKVTAPLPTSLNEKTFKKIRFQKKFLVSFVRSLIRIEKYQYFYVF